MLAHDLQSISARSSTARLLDIFSSLLARHEPGSPRSHFSTGTPTGSFPGINATAPLTAIGYGSPGAQKTTRTHIIYARTVWYTDGWINQQPFRTGHGFAVDSRWSGSNCFLYWIRRDRTFNRISLVSWRQQTRVYSQIVPNAVTIRDAQNGAQG
jgi:hypothetical protein